MTEKEKRAIISELWNCPCCSSIVTDRSRRVLDKETGKRRYGGSYLACPKGHAYFLSPSSIEGYLNGKTRLISIGSGEVFESFMLSRFNLIK